jgi:hypothetical protein
MKHTHIIIVWIILAGISFSQNQYTLMSYNLLNYPDPDTTIRNPYFRTTIAATVPDILVCEEMTSLSGVNGFLNNVLLPVYSGYAAGTFINGPDTDSEIFFKSDYFTFISNTAISTDLRNIYEFKLVENASGDTLRIYSVHLKASGGSSNEQQRLAEVNVLRSVTDALPSGSFFLVAGDFNIYGSTEPAYSALLNQSTPGYFVDLFNLSGTWNDAAYAPYHTQSTRTRAFGGGATGGLDDRFDMILMSQSIIDPDGISYIDNSYLSYGNDGNHYNDSINQPPNSAVGQEIANALHYSSDHLPVMASFRFNSSAFSTITLTALIEGFYNGMTNTSDTLTVELHEADSPYSLVDQTKIFPDQGGEGTGVFNNASNGTPYYIVIKHRNALETWSAAPQEFASNALSYDFTSSADRAYGNNLKLVGTKWCIYGGDVNQDGFVTADDLTSVFTDNVNGAAGYVLTDLNGDMFTDVEDLNLVFINNVLGVGKNTPP